MNDIYVPILSEGKAQLYLVEAGFQTAESAVFSICNRIKGQGNEGIDTLIDKIGSYYKDYKRISLTLKEVESNKVLKPDEITLNTQSIALGLLIKIIIQNENRQVHKQYDKIVITGNFLEDRLVEINDVIEKYNAIPKDNSEKILFVYISDKIVNLEYVNNVTIKQFNTTEQKLSDVINYIFATYIIDINYEPTSKKYGIKNPEILDDLIYFQLENKKLDLEKNSFQINILIDESKYPRNYNQTIMELYAFIRRQERILTMCFFMLFTHQFKTFYSAVSCNYKTVIYKILDSILCYSNAYFDFETTAIDVIVKARDAIHRGEDKNFLITPSIKKDDWLMIFKKNLFLPGFDERTNLEIIYETKVAKHKPLFPLFEVQVVLGSEWISNSFIPELLERFAILIENDVINETDLDLNNIFDANNWFVMGEH